MTGWLDGAAVTDRLSDHVLQDAHHDRSRKPEPLCGQAAGDRACGDCRSRPRHAAARRARRAHRFRRSIGLRTKTPTCCSTGGAFSVFHRAVIAAPLPLAVLHWSSTHEPTQPLLLQGEAGYSRKGPLATQASYYYSQPQLAVRASITRDGKREERTGHGWLDHEWSSTVLADDAAGWDWIGMNLDDGSALTAFSIRSQQSNSAPLHAYASLRPRSGKVQTFAPHEVRFSTTSPSGRHRARAPPGRLRSKCVSEIECSLRNR